MTTPSFKIVTGLTDPGKLPAYRDIIYWAGVEKNFIYYSKQPGFLKKHGVSSADQLKKLAKSNISTIRNDILEEQFISYLTLGEESARRAKAGSPEPDIIINEGLSTQLFGEVKALEPDFSDTSRKGITIGGQTILQSQIETLRRNDLQKALKGFRTAQDTSKDKRTLRKEEDVFREKTLTSYTLDFYNKNIKGKTTGQLLEFFKNSKDYGDIYRNWEKKARNLIITKPEFIENKTGVEITKIPTAILTFTEPNFLNDSHFYIKTSPPPPNINFDLYLRDGLANKVFDAMKLAINNEHTSMINGTLRELIAYTTEVEQGKTTAKFIPRSASKLETSGSVYVWGFPPTGSIPMGRVAAVPRRKSSAFTSRTSAARQTLAQTRTPSIGSFISNETITNLTKREMMRRMPIGPVGGPPLSSRVLTYRTGRFVQSLQVIADLRTQRMQYYYNPNYWIHEATSRNPRNLIDSSINSIARTLFGKRFELIKSNQSL